MTAAVDSGPARAVSMSPLSRIAGPIAILAGALVVLTRLPTVLFLVAGNEDLTTFVLGPTHAINGLASIVAFGVLALALVAIYERQAHAAGGLGVIGFAMALLGTIFMAGDWWYEAFAVPRIAEVGPELIPTFVGGRLLMGGVASFALLGIGWVVFAIASLRAHVYPTAIAATMLVGGLLSGIPIGFVYLTGQIILGMAIAWAGIWLRNDRTAHQA